MKNLPVWGFELAQLGERHMFSLTNYRLLGDRDAEAKYDAFQLLGHDPAMAAMIVAAGAFLSANQLGIFILQISQIVLRKPISISFALHQGSQLAFTRART